MAAFTENIFKKLFGLKNNENMTRRLFHVYENDWKIDVNLCKKNCMSIKPFSPIPDVNLLFDFSALYEEIAHDERRFSLSSFHLKLEKLYGFNINPTLEFDGKITLKYNSSETFKEFKISWFVNVDKMNCVHFDKVVSRMYNLDDTVSSHKVRMDRGPLILKCKINFYLDASLCVSCHREINAPNIFIEDFKPLFKSQLLSDVVFKIGEQSIPAHKVILAAHSPVFMTMLTQDFLETKTHNIEITDCTYEIFEIFLKYLYLKEIEDRSYPTVTELLVLSDKYDVSSLKAECAKILISHITVDNICEILKNAYDYNNDELKIPAIQFASVHFHELRLKEDWKSLLNSHLQIGYEITEKIILKG